jgi:ribonuclease HIII
MLNKSNEIIARDAIDRLSAKFSKDGYQVSEPKKENYSYSFEVNDGIEKVKLNVFFGKKGTKTMLQGNSSGTLFQNLNSELFGEKLFNDENKYNEPDVYIGTDESGKGDYFGPLVIAGVLVDVDSKLKLQSIGVKDSKEISDSSIKILAVRIKNIVREKFSLVKINPEKYNELYSKMGNINSILGWAHARALENILKGNKVSDAVSDKFGNPKTILNALMQNGKEINLHQEIKAEKYTAVAAASILARAEVINWFERNSKKYKLTIPKGVSDKVEQVAAKLIETISEDELKKLIKFHFKTSQKIFK